MNLQRFPPLKLYQQDGSRAYFFPMNILRGKEDEILDQ